MMFLLSILPSLGGIVMPTQPVQAADLMRSTIGRLTSPASTFFSGSRKLEGTDHFTAAWLPTSSKRFCVSHPAPGRSILFDRARLSWIWLQCAARKQRHSITHFDHLADVMDAFCRYAGSLLYVLICRILAAPSDLGSRRADRSRCAP